jgi:hypothetical protein
VPDCAALRTAAHQSPQWLFWSDPAMKPFHDKFTGKLEESLHRAAGTKPRLEAFRLRGSAAGPVHLRRHPKRLDRRRAIRLPGVVLLLDTGDKSDLLKTNLDALKKKWTDGGKPIRTEDVRGISFSIVTISTNSNTSSLTGILPRKPAGAGNSARNPNPESPSNSWWASMNRC